MGQQECNPALFGCKASAPHTTPAPTGVSTEDEDGLSALQTCPSEMNPWNLEARRDLSSQ